MIASSTVAIDAPKPKKPRKRREKWPRPPSPTGEPGAFDIMGFCGWAGISRTQAFKEIAAGRLKVRRIGKKPVVPIEEARAWLNGLPSEKVA